MVLLEDEGSPVVRTGVEPAALEACYNLLLRGG